jgi:outer membrane lipoprotein-sorting protein
MKPIFAIVLFLLSLFGFSQNDQKAKSVLDQVSSKTKSYPSITADFDFTMKNTAAKIDETSQGKILIQNNKYKLSLHGVEIFNDGTNQWTFMPDIKEVSISKAGAEGEEAINPASIFTIYEKGYRFVYKGEGTYKGKKTHQIELIPTTQKEFSNVLLEVEQATSQIASATMNAKDGNQYSIKINKMLTETKYPDATFRFDPLKNSGVNVVDMR